METLPDAVDLVWTADLSVGCIPLDERNRAMFNVLASAEQRIARSDFEQLSHWLTTRFDQFETLLELEEALLAKADYPELLLHQQLHTQARDAIHSMQMQVKECSSQKTLVELVRKSCAHLSLWLMQHILDADKLFFPYIDSRYVRHAEQVQ